MGNVFKLLATKHAIFKFYGSWLREAIKTTKFRVVAVTHGDNSQLSLPEKGSEKKLRVDAVTNGNDPQFFLVVRRNVKRKS